MAAAYNGVRQFGSSIALNGWLEGYQKGEELVVVLIEEGEKLVVRSCGMYPLSLPGLPTEVPVPSYGDRDDVYKKVWDQAANAIKNFDPNNDPNIGSF